MTLLSAGAFHCFNCGAEYPVRDKIGRRDTCPECDADLHCCKNCRHFNPSAPNQCDETQVEWVRDKDRANFCDYFEPRRGPGGSGGDEETRKDARSRFEDLFK